jgi:hypothetical protein
MSCDERTSHDRISELENVRCSTRCLALTVSYSKLHDITAAREVAAVTYGVEPGAVHGHQRKRTREILDRLARRGLIENHPLRWGSCSAVGHQHRQPKDTRTRLRNVGVR